MIPRIKNKKAYSDFPKVLKVLKSCLTPEHTEGAFGYLTQYMRCYKINPTNNPFLFQLCTQLIDYLIDTRQHAEDGHHNPRWNDWKVITTYPDIYSYVGKYFA